MKYERRDVGWAKLSPKAGQPAASFLSPMVSIFISILNSVPGVPTSFGQEFCPKSVAKISIRKDQF